MAILTSSILPNVTERICGPNETLRSTSNWAWMRMERHLKSLQPWNKRQVLYGRWLTIRGSFALYFQLLGNRRGFSSFPFCFERTTKFQGPGPITYSSLFTSEWFLWLWMRISTFIPTIADLSHESQSIMTFLRQLDLDHALSPLGFRGFGFYSQGQLSALVKLRTC